MASEGRESALGSREHCPAIVIIDRQTLVRSLLRQALLHKLDDIDVIGLSGIDELPLSSGRDVALVIWGLAPGANAKAAMRQESAVLGEAFPQASKMLLCTQEDDAIVAEALACGFKGVLSTATPVEIAVVAIQLVLAGGTYCPQPIQNPPSAADGDASAFSSTGGDDGAAPDIHVDVTNLGLTTRELQVLAELCRGRPNKVIARELSISENTAKMHVRRILTKLRVRNRLEAALLFQERRHSA